MRTIVNNLRRKLGDDADSPKYIFVEPHVGYRMPKRRRRDRRRRQDGDVVHYIRESSLPGSSQ